MTSKPVDTDRKLFDRLVVARGDLQMARRCALMIRKNSWHYSNLENIKRPTTHFHQSVYTSALVIYYGRIFTEAKNLPNFPPKILRDFDAEERVFHKILLAWRNEIYAHSDIKHQKVTTLASGTLKLEIVFGPDLRLSAEKTNIFLRMAIKLDAAIERRTDELHPVGL